ncbi:heme exporter protein CcmD [Marinomonas posidonica]|uniref:Heme exporter protein D n=1 Tax=Marinomonas posidonica (strain CECT 7376 / NCIMB 14433 / IVIA-Po-181) TaxID=491952 RepID=F6CSA8_MARPP|nr:heme exporter protein CcmD [Marinomonas posidonica]AEF53895.1 heme exporter protein CcmD [Marinomonas posidonica IVIA-Po-181]
MAFDSAADFFAMGKHGLYVWSAYGISGSVLVGFILLSLRERRKVRRQLHKRFLRDQ